ncbi:MAG: glycerol kinase, partial [Actinobacteria bacterium]|nr:glycerol kinase [Actinomycetota bacterium]
MTRYVLAIDNGTTSTRAILFDHNANKISSGQKETTQILPKPGWVEHDALEIWNNTREVINDAIASARANVTDVAAIGITNQRETTVVWDRATGKPVYNAIVWQDTRTTPIVEALARSHDPEWFRSKT